MAEVLDRFLVAELATFGPDGTPRAIPMTAIYEPEQARILTATSIGFPQKAIDIRRNPRVSLLYSDPTGSGLRTPPAVLVLGDAESPEEVVTTEGLERFWSILAQRQPASRRFTTWPVRPFSTWYFRRLRILVRIRRLLWWPEGDFGRTPLEVGVADVG